MYDSLSSKTPLADTLRPMNASEFPVPTEPETKQLSMLIDNWELCTELQRAICLVFLRDSNRPRRIAKVLTIETEQVLEALPGIEGIIVDAETSHLYFP